MTREEAIRELKADYCGNRIICELYPDQCNREECEIWWAINALENAKNDNLTTESAQNVPNQAFKMQKSDGFDDTIFRQAAINIVYEIDTFQAGWRFNAMEQIKALPSAQPEPISDAYMKAVWTWLLDYQIKAAELKGKYTPYEVLSWVANDWRKEHEGSD